MNQGAEETSPTVFVVDDDPGVRESIRWLLESVDLSVADYGNPQDFLDEFRPERPGCLLLDIRMPAMSGLDLQERLEELEADLPVVFITAHGDVPMAVRAMKSGALDFIEKPYNAQHLIEIVQHAIDVDRRRREEGRQKTDLAQHLERLTPRELEVARLVCKGHSNKGIANELGLSPKTVEVHRGRVMAKMDANSTAELVQMMIQAGVDC